MKHLIVKDVKSYYEECVKSNLPFDNTKNPKLNGASNGIIGFYI